MPAQAQACSATPEGRTLLVDMDGCALLHLRNIEAACCLHRTDMGGLPLFLVLYTNL